MDLFAGDKEETGDVDETAPAPESGELPAPRAATLCLGHEAVEQKLLEFYNGGKMPHALVFAGLEGVGKATMAYRFARFLFKRGVKGDAQDGLFGAPAPERYATLDIPANDPVFARVASGGHADLLTVERPYDETRDKRKAAVDVEEIRKVTPFFRMTAAEGGWRVVIIDDADTMNRNAQNALLKILEEPPKNALLILIAHRPGALIPTIRSRARFLRFEPLTDDAVRDLLARQGRRFSPAEFMMLKNLSGGSFGRALQTLEADGLALAVKTLGLLDHDGRRDWVSIHKFADELAGMEEGTGLLAGILQSVYDELARAKARGLGIEGFGVHKPFMERTLARSSLEHLLDVRESLQRNFIRLDAANLDKRQAVLAAFSLIS